MLCHIKYWYFSVIRDSFKMINLGSNLDYLQQGESIGLQCHPIIQFFFKIIISYFHFYWIFLHYQILPINFIIGYYPLSISYKYPVLTCIDCIHHFHIQCTSIIYSHPLFFYFFIYENSFQKQIRIRNHVLSQKIIEQETNQHAMIPLLKKLWITFLKNPRSNKIVSLCKSLAQDLNGTTVKSRTTQFHSTKTFYLLFRELFF